MTNTIGGAMWLTLQESLLAKLALVVSGSICLAISSKVQIPFYPVPMTMQTFVVISLGMAFGWRLAGATILLYLAEGAAGLPVFAGTPEKGIGLAYMMGGTGGYLVGYVLAAVVAGYLAQRGWSRSVLPAAVTALLAGAVIYVPGLLWLGILYGWDKPILDWGLYPFLYADAAKAALVAVLFPLAWSRCRPTN